MDFLIIIQLKKLTRKDILPEQSYFDPLCKKLKVNSWVMLDPLN
jgi:hypothetical protein